jgi:hypothetical protein
MGAAQMLQVVSHLKLIVHAASVADHADPAV